MSLPAVWGSGITWGSFKWGATTTTGRPTLYVAIDGTLRGEASAARFRLGRSGWFDVLQPNSASIDLVGDIDAQANSEVVLSCGAGALWKGYVDSASTTYSVHDETRTTVNATDIVRRLGQSVKATAKVYSSGNLIARWFPIGFYGDLVDVTEQYLADYAPGLSITVQLGTSTGSLPALTDWYFDAPGPIPKKTLLELLNKAEESSNAMMAMQPDGTLYIVPRAPSGLSTVSMVDVGPGDSTWTRGRDTVINRWLLENPAYDDNTVLDTTDTTSRDAYGEQSYEVQDYLCTSASHFGSSFRTALATPRWKATYTKPIADLSDPWLLLAPLSWVYDGSDILQVMSIDHDVTLTEWRITLELDASQDALNGATEPTPA